MSTMTRKSRSVKPFTCSIISLTIEINDCRYSVDEISAGEFGSRSFRLTKHSARDGGAVYDVVHDNHGCVACDCPSYQTTHIGTSSTCKHGRALVALGLMPAPAPLRHVPDEFDPAPRVREFVPEPSPAPVAEVPATCLIQTSPCCEPAEVAPCLACEPPGVPSEPTAEDLAEYHDWTGESIAREHLDRSARLTLAELVDAQAEFYESWANPCGNMLANAMRELALKVRLTDASTPDEFEARKDALDAEIREQYEAIGWEQGRRECQGEPAGSAFGHMA